MNPRDHLRAAARCWEHAGFFAAAAERYHQAEAWRDAGRCFSLAERHNDAAVAYSRAGERLLAAREHLMAERPGQARRLYEGLSAELPLSPSQQVEMLLTLGKIEEASRHTEDPAAMALFARLAASRNRPDLAWPLRGEEEWPGLAPWNRSLGFHLPPPETKTRLIWPSVEFGQVSLWQVWAEETSDYFWGHRALDWSADGRFLAAALDRRGIARGQVDSDEVSLERWLLPSETYCVKFLPESSAVLAGGGRGNVSLVRPDGQMQAVEGLRMPGTVWSIEFSKQGDRLAIASGGKAGVGALKIFSWQSGQLGAELARYDEKCGDCQPICAWANDPSRLVWSPGNWAAPNRLGMVIDREEHQIPNAQQDYVYNLRFTPADRYLLSGSADLVIRDGTTGQALAPPERFDEWVWGVAIHPQAAIVAVGEGQRLHLLRLHPGEVPRFTRLSEQTFAEHIKSLAFSPAGRHLLMLTEYHLRLFRVDLKP